MSALPLARRLRLTDAYGDLSFGGFVLSCCAGIAACFVLVGLVVILSMRPYGRGVCHRFAEQTGFRTKFVVLGFMDTGTCLAQAPNGQWVSNSKIVQFVQATKP